MVSLKCLQDAFHKITNHSAACQAPVELIGEVNRDGLSSTLLAISEKCHEEFKFTLSDKVMVIRKDGTSRSTHESNVTAVMGQIATGGGFSITQYYWCSSTVKACVHRHRMMLRLLVSTVPQ